MSLTMEKKKKITREEKFLQEREREKNENVEEEQFEKLEYIEFTLNT